MRDSLTNVPLYFADFLTARVTFVEFLTGALMGFFAGAFVGAAFVE